jgi:hypothetical protein
VTRSLRQSAISCRAPSDGGASLLEAHSGGRFVEQEPRLVRESRGDFEPLLLAVGQCGCSLRDR